MKDILEVKRLQLRTEVGFSSHELNKLQEIEVSVKSYTDTSAAGESDKVQDGIDIKPICKDIIRQVQGNRYYLIEAIAQDVAYICLNRGSNLGVEVKVEKPGAIRFSKFSAVTITRTKSDMPVYDVIISIGSNIDPDTNVHEALRLASESVGRISKVSNWYQTPAIDSSHAADKQANKFYNLAVEVSTHYRKADLKDALLKIETDMGRVRDPKDKFAPRCIDLDVSFHPSADGRGQVWLGVEDICKFPHVAVPISDIMPEYKSDATGGVTILSLAQQLTKLDMPSDYFPKVDRGIPDICKNVAEPDHEADSISNLKIPNGVAHATTAETPSRKTALITGGASKIGAHISQRLHNQGFNVAIHYCTKRETAHSLAENLNTDRAGSALVVQADLSVSAQQNCYSLVEEVIERWGRLDVVVNNASVFTHRSLDGTTEEVRLFIYKIRYYY